MVLVVVLVLVVGVLVVVVVVVMLDALTWDVEKWNEKGSKH